jgi:hypothetical protein
MIGIERALAVHAAIGTSSQASRCLKPSLLLLLMLCYCIRHHPEFGAPAAD